MIMLVQRQKDIVSLLIQEKKWYTFSQLAKEVNCSTKTIQRDILFIKELLPEKWHLQIQKGRGVILHKPADCSSSELNELFIRNELSFKILDILFKINSTTVMKLSEMMYISPTSLYPYLKNTEIFLKQFHLRLHRKPLRICGDSININFMYQELYLSSYGDNEWPDSFSKEKDCYLYITKIEEKLGIKLYPIYKRKLMYLIAVMLKRKQHGFPIYINPHLHEKVLDTPFYIKIFNLNKNNFHNYFCSEEIVMIVISINCSKYAYQNLLAHKSNVIHHFNKNDVGIYRSIKNLIFKLESTFECKFIDNYEFVFAIIQYLKQTLSRYQFSPIMSFSKDSTVSNIMNIHQDTFFKVKKVYTQWVNEHSINTLISDEEIATLTLHIEGIFMLKNALSIKILLIIEDGEKWELYLKGVLHLYFGPIFKFIYTDMNTNTYIDLDVDLIITSFSSIKSKIPIVRISPFPTKRELQDIKDFIYKKHFSED